MECLLAGVCVSILLASAITLFLLTIPASGDSRPAVWRQTHEHAYLNSLELFAAVSVVALLIVSVVAVWLLLG